LYSVPDTPQITTSVFYQGDYHYITYQTNEGVVDSVVFPSASEGTDEGYILEISIMPTHEGDFTVILPSIESDMFKNYCTEQDAISDSHFFFYLVDGEEVESEETDVNLDTKAKLHYNAYMNGVDLNNNDTCSGDRIELGAQDLAEATYLAQLTDWDETSNILSQADIDFNTDFTFYGDTNQCYPYYDIEWVANHEIGHAVGLDHNEGWFANSVMVPNCAGSWSTIQSDDSDALDTHYG